MRTVPPWIGKNDDTMPPPNVTLRIFARAAGCCQNCLRKLMAGEKWHRDHILALADGGENAERNFQILCDPCHGLKTSAEATERAKVRAKAKAVFGIKAVKAKIPSRPKLVKPERDRLPMPPRTSLFRSTP